MANLFESDDQPRTAPTTGRFAQVALEQGLEAPEGLTYAVPEELADLKPGDRVLVPLGKGNRTVSGYVLSLADRTELDPEKIKPIAARERESINLPDPLIELARWISSYYCCPLGMVFATMLPAAVKKGTGTVQRSLVDLADPIAADALPSIIKQHKLPPKQQAVLGKALELALLGKLPIEDKALADLAGTRSAAPVKGLVEKGLLKRVEKQVVKAVWDLAQHAPAPASEGAAGLPLTADQDHALERIIAALGSGFHVDLLHGVTGSGKTEVYIRAIEQVVAHDRVALVLVPEISLTPQTVSRFLGRFDRVAVLHSGLTAAQRHEQWLLIRDGWAQVIVGARSAVFAPTEKLGLIIVDEEHDTSYKQDQAPRYHGRDVAIKRAQMAGIPIVLGSATPSLESYYNALPSEATERRSDGATEGVEGRGPGAGGAGRGTGRYRLLEMPCRVLDRTMPKVEIVDLLRDQRVRRNVGSRGVHLLTRPLEAALRHTFEQEGQAMLLLNRRGYANYIACPDHQCGWIMNCDYCDAAMVYHKDQRVPAGGLVRCHYCSFENRLPAQCPVCGKKVVTFGLGTQRVEEEIERKLPGVRLLRMDSDAMRTGRDYHRSLEAFRRHEVDLLVGTQMIAKGLDFANVRLVGVISADTALNLPDFRATERTFQLVAQVAGRSGRAEHAGRVIVQTFTPDHPAIRLAADHDYAGFATSELEHRRQLRLPPVTRMARLVLRHRDLEKVEEEAKRTGEQLVRLNEELGLHVRIIGPIPPPISRIGGYHRMQIELIAASAGRLQRLIAAGREAGILRSNAHMAVDIDPVSLL